MDVARRRNKARTTDAHRFPLPFSCKPCQATLIAATTDRIRTRESFARIVGGLRHFCDRFHPARLLTTAATISHSKFHTYYSASPGLHCCRWVSTSSTPPFLHQFDVAGVACANLRSEDSVQQSTAGRDNATCCISGKGIALAKIARESSKVLVSRPTRQRISTPDTRTGQHLIQLQPKEQCNITDRG